MRGNEYVGLRFTHPPHGPSMRSTTRSRFLIFFAGLGVLTTVLIALIAVDFVIVKLVLDDEMDGLTREERAAAQEALDMVNTNCLDNPIMYGLTRKIRVVEVTLVPGCKRITDSGLVPERSFLISSKKLLACLQEPDMRLRDPECKTIAPYYRLVQGYQVVLQVYSVFAFPLVRIIECCNSGEFCMWWTGDSPIPDPCPSS